LTLVAKTFLLGNFLHDNPLPLAQWATWAQEEDISKTGKSLWTFF